MPRFVILIHDHPFLHWDFLLENGDRCRTWRLLTDPALSLSEIPIEALPNHRLMYLAHEGPVTGNRGSVVRWDAGTFEWLINEPGMCEVILDGQRWQGPFRLQQIDDVSWKGSRPSQSALQGDPEREIWS